METITPKIQPLIESKCKNSEYARNIWCVVPDLSVGVDDLLKPEYWANVAQNMRPMDRIEANAEDGSWFAEFMIMDTSRLWAKVELMRKVEFGKHEVNTAADGELFVKWNAGSKCYRVIRRSDSAVVQDDIKTKTEAHLWIATYNKEMAA